jgi:hypothetical protein
MGSSVGKAVTLGNQFQTYLNTLAAFDNAQGLFNALKAKVPNATVSVAGGELRFQFSFTQNQLISLAKYDVDLNLTDLGLNFQGSGSVGVTGTATASLSVGLDLGQGVAASNRFFIVTGPESQATMQFKINATNVSGTGTLGNFPITIQNGTIRIGTGSGLANNATGTVMFVSADGRVTVSEMQINAGASMSGPAFAGQAEVVLPVRGGPRGIGSVFGGGAAI